MLDRLISSRWLVSCLTLASLLVFGRVSVAQQGSPFQLTYKGELVADKGDPVSTRKKFTLTVTATPVADGGTMVFWVVDEDGLTQLPWPYQFGSVLLAKGETTAPVIGGDRTNIEQPAFAYEVEEKVNAVAVILPLLAGASAPAAEATWEQAGLNYRVGDLENFAGRPARSVLGFNRLGIKRTLFLAPGKNYLAGLTETVFLGMGEEHQLVLQIAKHEPLTADQASRTVLVYQALLAIREDVLEGKRKTEVDWKDEQLKVLRTELEGFIDAAAKTPLMALVARIEDDLKNQKGRSGGVALLRKRAMGQPVAETGFRLLRGSGYSDEQVAEGVTVLHFWEYQDKPLQDPYGQVGYLDFLYRKYGKQGLKVFGIVADSRLEDEALKNRTLLSARKFTSFMKVSYPVLVDHEAYLRKKLGDPRAAGAKLPLFIVLDKQGKIIEYHAGFYDIDRDRGLEQLDRVVKEALGIDE
jgi:hypothetical protein